MLSVRNVYRLVVLIPAVILGCTSSGLPIGAQCGADSDCRSGLCAQKQCLGLDADTDEDGLPNGKEAKWGLNPLSPDSDGDGRDDISEWADNLEVPADSDGDGKVDALESAILDADLDCLVDQFDADDAHATDDMVLLVNTHCKQLGVCLGEETTLSCDLGVPTCVYGHPGYEASEITCDGLDNDCDGQVDETLTWTHPDSGVNAALGEACYGVGRCGLGTVECSDDGTVTCSTNANGSESQAVEEKCDGLDDDCDGLADEDLRLGGPDGPALGWLCEGIGSCHIGVVECGSEDGSVLCSTALGGSDYVEIVEMCNGLDDNCDGQVDEGFFFAQDTKLLPAGALCGLGICQGGVVQCAQNQLELECSSNAKPSAEVCNGLDDDCDGKVDNGLSLAASNCWTLGVCALEGVLVPNCEDGQWVCETGEKGSLYEPLQEQSCDGLDNDCDGLIDESFFYTANITGEPLPVGSPCGGGACLGGTVLCAEDGKSAICDSLTNGEAEICDGKDNDCNGVVDEFQMWNEQALGQVCQGTGQCGEGIVVCHPETGSAVCSTNSDGPQSQAGPELCNGLDDNCDGFVDNEVLSEPWLCWAPGVCAEGGGIPEDCVNGVTLCDFTLVVGYEAGEEISCDGLDNDCDGTVDEYLPNEPGSGWQKLASGTPQPRYEMIAAASPNPQSASVVMFGGFAPEPMLLSDTWRYLSNGTWDELSSNGPSGRSGATLVTDHEGSQILLFGGVLSFGGFSAEVWRLDKNWNWTQLEPAGELAPRRGHAAVMVPETQWMWIIGGESDQGGNAVAALSMANPDKPKWIAGLPDGPGWRRGLAAAYVPGPVADSSGHIVVFGGTKQDESLAKKTWVLDLGEMGWIPVEAGNPPLRRDHRMVHHDGVVYLFGGANLVGTALGDLWRFDVQKLEWISLDTEGGPPARRLAAWIDREKSILLMGGSDGNKLFQDAWVFKPESQEWTELVAPAYPSHRSGALMEEMADNSVLLYGGYGTDDLGSVTLNDRWRFDPSPPGGWTHLGNMGPKRVGAALAYDPAGDRIFVHGGKEKVFDGTGEAALWTIHKDGSVDKSTKVASPLFGHSAVWDGVGKRLFLVGGMLNAETPGYQLVAVHEDMSTELLSAASPDSKEYFDELLVGARGFFHFENGNQLLMTTDNGLVLSFDLATHQWTELVAAGEIDTEKLGEPFLVPQGPNLLMGMNWIDLNDGSVQKVAVTTQPKSFEYSMGAYLQSSAKAYLFSGGLYPHRNSFWSLDFGCAE